MLPQIEASGERLDTVYADGAFAGQLEDVCAYFCGFDLRIIRKPPGQKGFVVLPKRWVVERTFAWLVRCRRLRCDYEFTLGSAEAMTRWAMIRNMLHRLTT